MTAICITLYILGAAESVWGIADANPSRGAIVITMLFWPIFTIAVIAVAIAKAIGAWRKSRKDRP